MQRCLFVDDEPLMLSTMKRLVKGEAYECVLALGPRAALEACRAAPFDVVVSDYRMPEMTGVELLSLVRALSPGTARLLLTGYSCPSVTADALADGTVERVLHKPFERETLIDAIRQALSP